MYSFEKVEYVGIDTKEFYEFDNKSIFTTIPWMDFIIEDNPGAIPIVIRIKKKGKLVGYFSAMKIKKMGISIVGSPFRGWSTCFMGIDTNNVTEDERICIYEELIPYIRKEYKCQYLSISDRNLSVEKSKKYFKTMNTDTLELRIDRSDEELFKVFKTDCRNFIRQFERRGAVLEYAEPNDEFAEEFYLQLIDVFDKQNLVPTYSVEKVKRLLRCLSKDDMVLCLRVRDPEGNSIATSIYPGFNNKFFFWGGASYRSGQHYRPNEYMLWNAIKYWRDRGAEWFDMVGVRDYKRKFGSEEVTYATIESAIPGLIQAKNMAEKLYFSSLKWKHKKSNTKRVEK